MEQLAMQALELAKQSSSPGAIVSGSDSHSHAIGAGIAEYNNGPQPFPTDQPACPILEFEAASSKDEEDIKIPNDKATEDQVFFKHHIHPQTPSCSLVAENRPSNTLEELILKWTNLKQEGIR
jgi:hypothetical protein